MAYILKNVFFLFADFNRFFYSV